MSEDEAVKRGAEAGWALGQALKEICAEKGGLAIRAAIEAMKEAQKGRHPNE